MSSIRCSSRIALILVSILVHQSSAYAEPPQSSEPTLDEAASPATLGLGEPSTSSENEPDEAQEDADATPSRTDEPLANPASPPPTSGLVAPTDAISANAPTPEPEPPRVLASLTDGFGVSSADGRYSLRIGGLFSVRLGLGVADGDVSPSAHVRLGRVTLGGNVFGEHVRYFLNVELAGKPQLLDLEIDLQARPELQLRVGQFRTPFSRQFIMPLFALQLPDRSIVSDFFRANRDTGLSAEGQLFGGRAEYRVGVFNGNGINTGGNDNRKLMVLGRVAFAPLGAVAYDETIARRDGDVRIAFGLGAYHDVKERAHSQVDLTTGMLVEVADPALDRTAAGLDFVLRAGPFTLSTEAFVDRRRAVDVPEQVGAGLFAQAGLFVLPGQLELAARFDWLAPDVEASRSVERYELGGTYYLFDARMKLQARYAYDHVDAGVRGVPLVTGHSAQLQVLLAI